MTGRPVLAIGLDAAELALIDRWCESGDLPHLARLRKRGTSGALATVAPRFAGGVWPTFYTGKDVASHGIYHNKLWRSETMRCEVPAADWLCERPFWERLDHARHRIGLVDVPMVLSLSRGIRGFQLSGWGTHDQVAVGSWPRSLWKRLAHRHGRPRMEPEPFGPQSQAGLERLRRNMVATTEQMTEIACSLLDEGPWDLFMPVLGAPHRAGHYLWDLSQVGDAGDRAADLKDALREIYKGCDRALGALVDRAPPGTRILVFALHGMGPNAGWSDLFPDVLASIEKRRGADTPSPGALLRLKRLLPPGLARAVSTRLPKIITDRLVPLWSQRMFDWTATRYFPVPMDQAGYLRLNVRGREPEGIVDPGDEYEALCDELENLFRGLRVIGGDEPIVADVFRAFARAPATAPGRDVLPDLVIEWCGPRAVESSGLICAALGELPFVPPSRLPSGRSGNHTARGWFVAAGEGIAEGARADGHILDLAPTLCRWLDVDPPGDLEGQPLPLGG